MLISEPNLDSKSDIAIKLEDDLDPLRIEGGRGLRVGVKGNLSKSALQVLDKLPKQLSGKNTQVRRDVAVPTVSAHVKADSWAKIVANGGLQSAQKGVDELMRPSRQSRQMMENEKERNICYLYLIPEDI
ncbi:hypothetical protein U1Q18_040584 [Sarracenia purpurea var. burkii]